MEYPCHVSIAVNSETHSPTNSIIDNICKNIPESEKMSQPMWTQKGETLSHKNACKEFGLEESEIIAAIRDGKLQYRENFAHGNPYFRLLRNEVIALVKELHGENAYYQPGKPEYCNVRS